MKTEIAKASLPTEPEQGIKWRKDVAEVDLDGTPATITDTDGEVFEIPKGYSVSVERWSIESDHELILGEVYGMLSKKFGKEFLSYVSPLAQVARRGGNILYHVQKVKAVSSAPPKSNKEVELDGRLDKIEALLQKFTE